MQNLAFIINPFSAKGKYQSFLKKMEKEFPKALYYISNSVKGTEIFIENNFSKVDIFIAVGGDGTISSIAKKLIGTDKILGIYPAGSGNGFAYEMDFTKDTISLINKIKNPKIREVDTFTVNGHLSINVSGIGFDGAVTKAFENTNRGFANYIKTSIKTFFKYSPIQINFKEEELKKYNGKYLMFNIANTRQFGNHAYIAPKALANDGLLDLVLVKKFPLWYSPIFAVRMFRKQLKSDRFVTFLKKESFSFEANAQDWHLDGEYNEITSPILVEVSNEKLKILY
ncbi:diacylglycerol/lipid kinase family protein [Riemerella anatipestifer]|uniref:Diacylglycerol kinase n=1 Tax=Riemerella anatipestifer TaxID=34085 RepID=A0A1S7DUQ9_RIEAN|nr:diacylglycerol kinase family protein [Riemerella anatipestifer]AQY22850.1 Diacylglycerol kinase [Riemerella anatipestifer]MCO4304384.1 diacylglycerol kinase [Riemerella anatipestifer]MCO7351963.1 diacylglycerol kinase [Riemerella anatipestifer]MCQ4038991.1 diacylglycerol kinase [Riemerella anatipestifer]MCT6761357.1 diacylglycerol kinase family protein [Riemerella anatipestifer]